MHSVLKPNYRRARILFLEIEALRAQIEECEDGQSVSEVEIDELKAELNDLEHEFRKTGVTSEYQL